MSGKEVTNWDVAKVLISGLEADSWAPSFNSIQRSPLIPKPTRTER